MSEPAVIQLLDDSGQQVRWHTGATPGGPGTSHQGSLGDAAAAIHGQPAVLLVPGADVTLMRAQVPTRNRQRMLKALPYAIEDQLIDEVDALHFAAGDHDTDGTVATAIVSKARLQQWLNAAQSAGLNVVGVIPETLALPWQENTWTAWLDHDRCLVRTGPQSGFAVDAANAAAVVELALAGAGKRPATLTLLHPKDSPSTCADLETLTDIQVVDRPLDSSPVALLAGGYRDTQRHRIDLLQGSYAPRTDAAAHWRAWRPAAAVAVLLLVFQLGSLVYERQHLRHESATLNARMTQIFRTAFPKARRIVDAPTQMKTGLAALERAQGQVADGFLDLLARCGPALQATHLTLRSVNYDNGQLEIDVDAPDVNTLDRLKQQLVDRQLNVDIRSAVAGQNTVSGRLRITGGAS